MSTQMKSPLRYLASAVFTCALSAGSLAAIHVPKVAAQAPTISFEDCDPNEQSKLRDAWSYLTQEVAGPLRGNFESCIDSAVLVELPTLCSDEGVCNDCRAQFDRSTIKYVVTGEHDWNFICVEWPPSDTAQARAGGGANVVIDKSFLAGAAVHHLAALLSHEMAHNYTFEHAVNDFGSPLYQLTVPRQIETCVYNAASGGGPNPAPAGHVDGRSICF